MCEAEEVVIAPGDKIVYTRTVPSVPPVFSEDEWEQVTKDRVLHERGEISNICADWGMVLSQGLLGRRRVASATLGRIGNDPDAVDFLAGAVESIDAVLGLVARYAERALKLGRTDLAEILANVPANPSRTFHEALQSLRFCHGAVWLGGHYHVGFGRFDQYIWPYLKTDLESGKLSVDAAEDLLAEFFIALNRDTDLYPGVQRGDNGQTIMLGGVKRDGSDAVNPLTWMVLRVAREVGMIDPKINLRIGPDTSLDLLVLATELTRKGLGFPQYSNDAVVIPGLVAHGYDLEDARDYAVAACWEFLIPGKGMEVVNFGALAFPEVADRGIRWGLTSGRSFEEILQQVSLEIDQEVDKIRTRWTKLFLPPAPYYSVLMDDCLERGLDISKGGKYNNIGVHGACCSSAADALAAVRQFVFRERVVTPEDLLAALEDNFQGWESLRRRLAEEGPKVGNNDDNADQIMNQLFAFFADACEKNRATRRFMRPGTGTASQYLKIKGLLGASAEGRRRGEAFSANLSPAPGIRVGGPISVIQSFAKIDYKRVCNGGPVTMEMSDTVFRDPESMRKVAMLVRTFAKVGCQQLQLNALSHEKLLDAKKHPEKYRDLIVRVWGWSGYFCELAPEYQDHVIRRHYYATAG
jgi:formate C-acetyltransferase